MKIGELAQKTGLAASAIRFYEARQLIAPPTRAANGYREYGDEALHRLRIVQKMQKLGFSLDIIRSFFMPDGLCAKARAVEQIDIRLDEVKQLEAALAAQRAELHSLRRLLEESIQSGGDPGCAAVRDRHSTHNTPPGRTPPSSPSSSSLPA
jgi:MerR family transcriptional regulator, copper efflux regulator